MTGYLIHIKELVNVRKIKTDYFKDDKGGKSSCRNGKRNSVESSLKPFRSLEKALTFRGAISLRIERKDGNGEVDKGYSCEYRILTKEE